MAGKSEIKIDDRAWKQFFKNVETQMADPSRMLQTAFMTAGFRDVIEHFEKEEGPQGPWAKRSPETQFRYAMISSGRWAPPAGMPAAAFNPTNKLLQQTGALRQGFLPGNIRRKSKDAIVFFNNDQKSAIHDEGLDGMPQREFMWLSDRANTRMAHVILNFLADEK